MHGAELRRLTTNQVFTNSSFFSIVSPGRENWRDLIGQQIKDEEELQGLFFKFLTEDRVTSMDLDEAIYWYERLNYPRAKLPYIVQDELTHRESGRNNRQAVPDDDEDWDAVDGSKPDIRSTFGAAPPAPAAGGSSWAPEDVGWGSGPQKADQYLKLDVGLDRVVFVDTKEKFEVAKNEIRDEVRLHNLMLSYRH